MIKPHFNKKKGPYRDKEVAAFRTDGTDSPDANASTMDTVITLFHFNFKLGSDGARLRPQNGNHRRRDLDDDTDARRLLNKLIRRNKKTTEC